MIDPYYKDHQLTDQDRIDIKRRLAWQKGELSGLLFEDQQLTIDQDPFESLMDDLIAIFEGVSHE